jgi:dihydrofolate reductase
MRRVILQEFVSIDGLAAGPNGSVDFVPASMQGDQSFGRNQMALMESVDAILLGRVTYQMFAGHFPEVKSGEDKPFADKINAIPKIVFSKTLDRAPWGKFKEATIARDALKEVAKLKKGSGKDMVFWGSISLAQSLMKEGLIDEYQLVVCPIVLGEGTGFFRDKADLKLLRANSFDRGAVLLAYTNRQE